MKHLCYFKYYLILLLDLIVELVGRASRAECSSIVKRKLKGMPQKRSPEELKGSDWIEGACIKTVRIQFKFLDDLPKL